MAILFVGSEPSDFSLIGTAETTSTARRFDPASARGATALTGPTNVGATTGNAINIPFAKNAKVWMGMVMSATALFNTRPWVQIFDSADGTGQPHFYLCGTGSFESRLQLVSVAANGQTTVVATSADYFSPRYSYDYFHKVDICFEANRVRVYGMRDNLIIDYTGPILRSGSTGFDRIVLANSETNNSFPTAQYSEVVVATTCTRTLRVRTLIPNAITAQGGWSGTVGDINEFALDTGTVAQTTTANDTLTVSLSDIAADSVVRGIVLKTTTTTNTVDPQTAEIGYTINGVTTYANVVPLTNSFTTASVLFEPVGGLTGAQVNGMTLSLRSGAVTETYMLAENGDMLVYEDGTPITL